MKKCVIFPLLLIPLLQFACQSGSLSSGDANPSPAVTAIAPPDGVCTPVPVACAPCPPAIGPGTGETTSPLPDETTFYQQVADFLASREINAEYDPNLGLVVISNDQRLPVYISLIQDGGGLYRLRLDREAWYVDTRNGVPGLDWWATVSIINRDRNTIYAVLDPDLENHLWLRSDFPFAETLSLPAFHDYILWYTHALDEIFMDYDFLSLQ